MIEQLAPWGLRTKERRRDIALPGSPERCIARSVVQDTSGKLWMLERISREQAARRAAIGTSLDALHRAGISEILPYQATTEGDFVATFAGFLWQLSPYFASDALPRPDYVNEADRGASLASFLVNFRGQEDVLSTPPAPFDTSTAPQDMRLIFGPALNLRDYASELVHTLEDREPAVHKRLMPLLERIQPLLNSADTLPRALCHGDLHPINVLWSGTQAAAVIDWEFLGIKPECYDAANLIGCVGFENPSALTGPFVNAFLQTLAAHGLPHGESRPVLVQFIAAQRLAWLSEWLRKEERDLLDMELSYIEILLDSETQLLDSWEALWSTTKRQGTL